jgi:hypothetical protein
MEKQNEQLEALNDIRQMMKQSSKFLSLSGLSGIFAGVYALIGAYLVYINLVGSLFSDSAEESRRQLNHLFQNFILIAFGVLIFSIITAYYFSNKKAKKNGQTLFDHTALRVLINLCIPLFAGGIFCIALLFHGSFVFIAPCMLLFYGLALINASKYTYNDIRYFGLCEIILGLINAFYLGYGLLFWAIGFGLLHIIYGAAMWFKYERKQ